MTVNAFHTTAHQDIWLVCNNTFAIDSLIIYFQLILFDIRYFCWNFVYPLGLIYSVGVFTQKLIQGEIYFDLLSPRGNF